MRLRTILVAIAVLVGLVALALAAFVATFDANRYKPRLIELVREQTGRTLQLDGDLSLSLWPRISLTTGPASLSGANGSGESARFQAGRAAVALGPLLSRQLVVEGMSVEGLAAALGDPAQGGGWRLEGARLHTDRIASGEAGRLELDGRLLQAGGDGALALDLESGYLPDFASRKLRLDGVEAQLTGVGGLTGLQARIGGDLDADMAASRIDARRLAFDATLAGGIQLALAGTGMLDLQADRAQLALQGKLDESPLQLQASAASLAPLALKYQLSADQVDVDRLRGRFASQAATPPPGTGSAAAQAPPAAPVTAPASSAPPPAAGGSALSSIGAFDTQGTLKVGRLKVSGLTVENLAANATTGGNRIAVEPLTGRLNGGALQAGITMAEAGHRLKASLTAVDAGALIRDATGRDIAEGRGNVSADLGARGESAEALTRSLSGTASLALRDGAVKGIDLDKLLQAVRDALDGRLPVEQRPRAGDRTPFGSLTASFKLAGGVARSDDLDFRANWVRAAGAGQADLGARTLDWLIRATLTGADPARKAAWGRLQGLTVPIRLSGSFDDPSYRVEVKDLIGEAATREIERRIEKEIGERLGRPPSGGSGGREGAANPLDQLRDLLRR